MNALLPLLLLQYNLKVRGHEPFDRDVKSGGSYVYTSSNAPLSSLIANKRQSEMIAQAISSLVTSHGVTSILDIGCGDGKYTSEFSNLVTETF